MSNGFRILITDDNEINQMVTQEILEKAGYKCRIAGNGQEAIDLLKKRYFDVVLMDCQMPVMDGFTATRELRKLQAAGGLHAELPPHVPIIALTANAVSGDKERCLAAGMSDYVTKPVDPAVLLSVLSKHLTTQQPPVEEREAAVTSTSPAREAIPPVDWQSLGERCGGDFDFASRVVEKFTRRLRDDVQKISDSLRDEDFDQTRRLAHALKGAAASVSAMPIAEAASAIETLARQSHSRELPLHAVDLCQRVDDCIDYVELHLAKALHA